MFFLCCSFWRSDTCYIVPLVRIQYMSQIARFVWPTWGPPGSWRPLVAPWILLPGQLRITPRDGTLNHKDNSSNHSFWGAMATWAPSHFIWLRCHGWNIDWFYFSLAMSNFITEEWYLLSTSYHPTPLPWHRKVKYYHFVNSNSIALTS